VFSSTYASSATICDGQQRPVGTAIGTT